MKVKILMLGAVIGALAMPLAAAAQAGGENTGSGGAKENMKPSTVGKDQRPDREDVKNRQPQFQANEPDRPAVIVPVAPPPGR